MKLGEIFFLIFLAILGLFMIPHCEVIYDDYGEFERIEFNP